MGAASDSLVVEVAQPVGLPMPCVETLPPLFRNLGNRRGNCLAASITEPPHAPSMEALGRSNPQHTLCRAYEARSKEVKRK